MGLRNSKSSPRVLLHSPSYNKVALFNTRDQKFEWIYNANLVSLSSSRKYAIIKEIGNSTHIIYDFYNDTYEYYNGYKISKMIINNNKNVSYLKFNGVYEHGRCVEQNVDDICYINNNLYYLSQTTVTGKHINSTFPDENKIKFANYGVISQDSDKVTFTTENNTTILDCEFDISKYSSCYTGLLCSNVQIMNFSNNQTSVQLYDWYDIMFGVSLLDTQTMSIDDKIISIDKKFERAYIVMESQYPEWSK